MYGNTHGIYYLKDRYKELNNGDENKKYNKWKNKQKSIGNCSKWRKNKKITKK